MEHNEDLRERMCSETSDLISRSRLIDDVIIVEAVMKANGDKAAANAVAMVIRKVENTPAVDAVAVVRCKQCVYYDISHKFIPNRCERAGNLFWMEPDGFCSCGERRGDDGERN